MSQMTQRRMFMNLPVRDVKRSIEFYTKLGFELDPKFANGDDGGCVVINGETSLMLLAKPFFKTFTTREVCDTGTHLQALFTVSCASRAEVDELVHLAVANGGQAAGEAEDRGFMYDWSFYDPDGHGWGVFWMNV